ncbi:MAG: transposase, partial [Synergistaceae bacterium]|nr:transposase [Synergistaceae bacterium]
MLIAHKIAIDPNNRQATYLARAAGTARFAYNWALAEWGRQYEAWKQDNTLPKPNQMSLRPNLGWVRIREILRFEGKVVSAIISRVANRWYVSITVDTPDAGPSSPEAENQGMVGVDLGVTALATLSTGEVIQGLKAHKIMLQRLRRILKNLSRKVKGSKNHEKSRRKLAWLHARIAHIRQDALHKLTTDLTREFHTIGIEDLNVKGMMKNRHLSRSIADMSFHEFRRQLEYKAAMRGGEIVVADRFFASSKTCATCGHKLNELPLSVHRWTCPSCGEEHDRDVNAAINLRNYAVSSTVSACGGEGAGRCRKTATKPAPAKQEANSKFISGH